MFFQVVAAKDSLEKELSVLRDQDIKKEVNIVEFSITGKWLLYQAECINLLFGLTGSSCCVIPAGMDWDPRSTAGPEHNWQVSETVVHKSVSTIKQGQELYWSRQVPLDGVLI